MADKFYCWPDWMPKAQRSGYSYEPADRRSKTDMEVGSVIRVNFITDETTLDCTLVLNTIQAQWFEKFERDMLRQGAQWFQMPIMIAGCIEWHTVRFASRPKAGNLIGPYHTTYNLKLEVQERDLKLCEQLMDMMLCVSPKDIMKTSDCAREFWLGLDCIRIPWFFCCELLEVVACVPYNDVINSTNSVKDFWVSLNKLQIPSYL